LHGDELAENGGGRTLQFFEVALNELGGGRPREPGVALSKRLA